MSPRAADRFGSGGRVRIPAAASLLLLFAQATAGDGLFDADSVLGVTLTGPLSTLLEQPGGEQEYPFVIAVDQAEQVIAVRTRGNSRLRVCEFPPLRLNLARATTDVGILADHDKLKLVTHCRNSDRGEQDMLEEYLAYRLFSELTDASFGTRLLRIRYVDTDGRLDADAILRYGFLIEPEVELAKRLGGVPADLAGVPKRRHDLAQASLLYLFQYMIGNTDWGLVKADYDDECCHNVFLIDIKDVIHTIPYDFDLAGLVNARYAYPDPSLRIKNVRQRMYRGLCTGQEWIMSAIHTMRSKRERLLALPASIEGLDDGNVRKVERYLEDFFELAAEPDRLLRRFERRCL